MEGIRITDYNSDHQEEIDQMMVGIEMEFSIPITSPKSPRIYEVYQNSDHKFWVALYENKVVGTIGLSLFSNNNAVLKRMMVTKEFR